MIDNEEYVQLSEHCFNACLVLDTAIRGENVEDLSGPVMTALEGLERCVDYPQPCSTLTVSNNSRFLWETERTLRGGVNTSHTIYDKEKVEEHKLAIQEILGVLSLRNSSFGEHPSVIESPTPAAPVTLAAESGTFLPPLRLSSARY